jgi:3-keto-5-aminohexanoate cleavage enzyme
MLNAMVERGICPECECFDTGIVRSISMFEDVGLFGNQPVHVSLVMGVASGMPNKASWLPLLLEEMKPTTHWQTIVIGRDDVWPTLRRAVELGGNVRTGLEDTFYLPDGKRAGSNGRLIRELVKICREVGREPATIEETRAIISAKKQS